jgi:hypothetical protein
MNVKSCLKVSNGLLYRTVSLKLEEVSVAYRDSCPFLTTTCDKVSFLALLDTDDVCHIDVIGGGYVFPILQNDWWLNRSATSPRPGFVVVFSALCFRQ